MIHIDSYGLETWYYIALINRIRRKRILVNITIETKRLRIRPIALTDAEFIYDLVNSEGWLRYIGDRNIANAADAEAYIQNILDKSLSYYNVIQLRESGDTLGVVTLLQREDQVHPDIGFALLPQYEKNGYALEASKAYLNEIIAADRYDNILGITLTDNHKSITLLKKIGLTHSYDSMIEDQTLSYFSLHTINEAR